ncbi:MAG: hypothetical protein KAI83_12995, partial [Thiomargarita sp.]|nr:hypothetical protein [Thiomargarita sp.]
MKFTKAQLCDPKQYGKNVDYAIGLASLRRQNFILNVSKVNPFLAVLCVKEFRGKSRRIKEELRASIKEQSLSQIQHLTERDSVKNAVFALYELKEYDEISRVFSLVKNLEQITYYQPIIQGIFSNSKDSNLFFLFLNILFDNLPTNKRFNKSPAYRLWLSALENLPDSILTSEAHYFDLEKFYQFFASQNNYSPSLHLFPEKFKAKFDKFKQILSESKKSSRLKEIYLNLIKRNPSQLADYLKDIKTENIPLDTRAYNRLIHYTGDFKTAISLFQEMKQQKLPIDEITYSTLINKANYEQAIK